MIVVRLMGGLGNQLFQYAAGRNLAILNNSALYPDTAFLENYFINKKITPRKFELDKFCTVIDKVSPHQIYKLPPITRFAPPQLLWKFNIRNRFRLFHEDITQIDTSFLKQRGDTYLVGYFSSELYFKENRDILLKEIKPRVMPDTRNKELMALMRDQNSVAVHIRRGDHLQNKEIHQLHGICGIDYYREAMQKIQESAGDCTFYYFSDDPEWVAKNFEIKGKDRIIVHNTGAESYWDMILMSQCRHNITANSSFSWWGAWLNQHEDNMTICPNQWYLDERIKHVNHAAKNWISLDPRY